MLSLGTEMDPRNEAVTRGHRRRADSGDQEEIDG